MRLVFLYAYLGVLCYGQIDYNAQRPQFMRGAQTQFVALLDDAIEMHCEVQAYPRPSVTWYHNNRPVLFASNNQPPRNAYSEQYERRRLILRDNNNLRLREVRIDDQGEWQCVVSNRHGTIARTFTVEILDRERCQLQSYERLRGLSSNRIDKDCLCQFLFSNRLQQLSLTMENVSHCHSDYPQEYAAWKKALDDTQPLKLATFLRDVGDIPRAILSYFSREQVQRIRAALANGGPRAPISGILDALRPGASETVDMNSAHVYVSPRVRVSKENVTALSSALIDELFRTTAAGHSDQSMQQDAPNEPKKQVDESLLRDGSAPDIAVPSAVTVTPDIEDGTNTTALPLRFEGHCVTECPWSAPAARTVHLRCKVYGEATIVWYAPHYSDVPIDEQMPRPGQTGRYTIQVSYDQFTTTSELIIIDAATTDNGLYRCVAYSGHDVAPIEKSYRLTVVNQLRSEPIIITEQQDRHVLKNSTVQLGQSAMLECKVLSDQFTQIYWTRVRPAAAQHNAPLDVGDVWMLDELNRNEHIAEMTNDSAVVDFYTRRHVDRSSDAIPQSDSKSNSYALRYGNENMGRYSVQNVFGENADFDSELSLEVSVLTIQNVSVYDAGMYMCLASNNVGHSVPAFAWLHIEYPCTENCDSYAPSPFPSKYYVVIVVSMVVAFVLVATLLLRYVYKDRRINRKRIQQSQLIYGKTIRVVDDDNNNSDWLNPPKVQIDYAPASISGFMENDDEQKLNINHRLPVKYVLPDEWHRRWEIDYRDLRVDWERDFLDEGTFGKVAYGEMRVGASKQRQADTSERWVSVAVKTLKEHCADIDAHLENLMKELGMMIKVGTHENVISLIGFCTSNAEGGITYPQVVVELAWGNLVKCLRYKRQLFCESPTTPAVTSSPRLPPAVTTRCQCADTLSVDSSRLYGADSNKVQKEHRIKRRQFLSRDGVHCFFCSSPQLTYYDLIEFALQIARGMQFLSARKAVHRDLAARNVLVSHHVTMKISDFGLARDMNEKEYYRMGRPNVPVPVKWMSPEALNEHKYSEFSDVWSFGIVLYELLTMGGCPYPSIPQADVQRHLAEGKRMKAPEGTPDNIDKLMQFCWRDSPSRRPTFAQIVDYLESWMYSTPPTPLSNASGQHVGEQLQYSNVTRQPATVPEPGYAIPDVDNDMRDDSRQPLLARFPTDMQFFDEAQRCFVPDALLQENQLYEPTTLASVYTKLRKTSPADSAIASPTAKRAQHVWMRSTSDVRQGLPATSRSRHRRLAAGDSGVQFGSINGHSSEEANSSNESFRNGAAVCHIEEVHEPLASRYSDPPRSESTMSNCDGVNYVNVGAPTRAHAELTYTSIKKPVPVPSGNNGNINTSGYASGSAY